MITTENVLLKEINNPIRQIVVKVELYNSNSTLVSNFFSFNELIDVKIERCGEGKFFGYGVCQKITVNLLDINRDINITTTDYLKLYFGYYRNGGIPELYNVNLPYFYITEVNRDEVTNKLTVVGYDKMYWASSHTVSEFDRDTNYNIYKMAWACCNSLGLQKPVLIQRDITTDTAFIREYVIDGQTTNAEEANYTNTDGTETIRKILDDIAEVTQTIYFIQNGTLYFSRLSENTTPVYDISKDRYFDLSIDACKTLTSITSTNELGDAVTASNGLTGTTVYIKDNVFWDLQEDISDLVDTALNRVSGFTMYQFDCKWRGNPLLTIGDKISLINKDDTVTGVYYINSTITYNGGLEEQTEWTYSESELETANNPTSLGSVLNQTSAKVDKVNKEIELVISNVDKLAEVTLGENGLSTKVSELQKNSLTLDDLKSVNDDILVIKQQVSAQMTPEDVQIEVGKYIDDNGIQEVVTSTGFTFNEEGLTIEKSYNKEMKTTITEDGMTVYRDNKAMLTANNQGVDAVNLKASTYLIIGENSRFEDYGSKRTGCFWIGG